MIAIIDYGVGNLYSVSKAFEKIGATMEITREIEKIQAAEKIVLPGVGAFGDCMKNLEETKIIPVLLEEIQRGKPLLGICVGMQLLLGESEESPGIKGLGIISGRVRKIRAEGLKIPHMGWNKIKCKAGEKLFEGITENDACYFVHSYQCELEEGKIATTEYGEEITAALRVGKIYGTQFHPEKSGDVGLKILSNFVNCN